MRGLLLNVMESKVQIVQANGLKDYYRLIDCSTIDIVKRRSAGKYYEIICDDEGLLKENPKISAIDDMGQPSCARLNIKMENPLLSQDGRGKR